MLIHLNIIVKHTLKKTHAHNPTTFRISDTFTLMRKGFSAEGGRGKHGFNGTIGLTKEGIRNDSKEMVTHGRTNLSITNNNQAIFLKFTVYLVQTVTTPKAWGSALWWSFFCLVTLCSKHQRFCCRKSISIHIFQDKVTSSAPFPFQ